MAFLALSLALIAGWFHWSGWFAIPIGIVAFIGAHRSLPTEGNRINAVGIIGYCVGALVSMLVAGWLQQIL